MKLLLFCFLALAWIPRAVSNAVNADPVKDPWNYQLMDVTGRFIQTNVPMISLTYLMNSARDPGAGGSDELGIMVMTQDCVASVPFSVISPAAIGPNNVMPVVAGTRAWDIDLTLNTQNLQFDGSQNDFLTGDEFKFTLRLCIRTDMRNLVSRQAGEPPLVGVVAYDETNVQVDIELTAILGPLAISARADERSDLDEESKINYPTTTCQCDDSNRCIVEERHPNEDIRVCVLSDSSLVELFDIDEMVLQQGGRFVTVAVSGRTAIELFAVQKFAATDSQRGQIMVVQFPALPVFYDNQANPAAIEISGRALMRFRRSGGGGRRLEDDPDVAGVGEFSVSVDLNPTVEDSSASKLMGAIAIFFALTSTLFLM